MMKTVKYKDLKVKDIFYKEIYIEDLDKKIVSLVSSIEQVNSNHVVVRIVREKGLCIVGYPLKGEGVTWKFKILIEKKETK